jgi:itaconyl-CoA hydratase
VRRPYAFEPVGPNRYREVHGLYYDEFDVGDVIEHRPGRTVTATDNMWLSLLSLNAHPLHIDEVYAGQTEFGQPLVSSLVTLSIVGGLSTNGTSARAIANLGWDSIRLTAPVFAGDTIYAESEVTAKRLSASRPGAGIVTFTTRGRKQDDTVFLTMIRSALIPLSPGAAAQAAVGADDLGGLDAPAPDDADGAGD